MKYCFTSGHVILRPVKRVRKNPAAVALAKRRMVKMSAEERQEVARAGGKAGGKARAEKLTAEQRREIARNAANKRWAAAKNAGLAVIVLGLAYAGWRWM